MGINRGHYDLGKRSPREWNYCDGFTKTNSDLFWEKPTIVARCDYSEAKFIQALRGSAASFGIITSFEVNTFAASPSVTIFDYQWDFKVPELTEGLAAWRKFVQTNIPPEFGGEVNLWEGSSSGTVSFTILGGWYDTANKLNVTIAPLLADMPRPPQNTKLTTGTYIESIELLAGDDPERTRRDNFYAKSPVIPMSSPKLLLQPSLLIWPIKDPPPRPCVLLTS